MFLEEFVEKCQNNLLVASSKVPLAYLVSRGITLTDIKKYKIGFSGNFISRIPETDSDSKNFNFWIRNISKRITLPIFDELGKIRGVETRALDQSTLINTLESKYKEKFRENILKFPENSLRYNKFYLEETKFVANFFGLPAAMETVWKEKAAYLTEGAFDCISLAQIFPNSLSALTANINDNQISWLKRYTTKIYLVFDSDKKGREAATKVKKLLVDTPTQVIEIGIPGKDINAFHIEQGLEELKKYITEKLKFYF